MFARLLLLFTLVPAVELALLIVIGQRLGVLPTVALILITGLVGAWLARREGSRTWREFRAALSTGRVPGEELQQGLAILIGGALLLTPGVVTDLVGLLLLLPPSRQVVLREVRRRIERRLLQDENRLEVRFWTREPPPL
ncbi:MAG TPA: FxsA family protein [Longimicrobiaceae bacterium]|nr:FxsA family protein [Longimicrobiaceae bacterium]